MVDAAINSHSLHLIFRFVNALWDGTRFLVSLLVVTEMALGYASPDFFLRALSYSSTPEGGHPFPREQGQGTKRLMQRRGVLLWKWTSNHSSIGRQGGVPGCLNDLFALDTRGYQIDFVGQARTPDGLNTTSKGPSVSIWRFQALNPRRSALHVTLIRRRGVSKISHCSVKIFSMTACHPAPLCRWVVVL